MADVDQVFLDRWRSGRHVGAARPYQFAYVRRGGFVRDHKPFTFLDGSDEDFATIPGGHDAKPWWAEWVPTTPWKVLPNLTQVVKSQGFDNNGFQQATIEIENVVFKSLVGALGTYHAIARGLLSPWRGFTNFGRPHYEDWMVEKDPDWYSFLVGAQIKVVQGYGEDHWTTTYTGLIDDVDMTSNPDHMTLTTTCFGTQTLAQQRFFGRVKDPLLRAPVTFADRLHSDDVKYVGGGAKASSSQTGKGPQNITRKDDGHDWWSQGHNSEDVTEWVEIKLPRGRYETFTVFPKFSKMEMYVSVFNRDRVVHSKTAAQKKAQVDNVDVNEGWFDPVSNGSWSDLTDEEKAARVASGDHIVPGYQGGFPYLYKVGSIDNRMQTRKLGHQFEVGDNTALRVSFRNLHYHPDDKNYVAAVKRLVGIQRHQKKEVKKNHWILVDDAADVVKVILRWAGFREWEVESFGVRLKDPLVFHQSDFLIDGITRMVQQADFQFFMGDPTSHDLSIGVPKFRHTRALTATPTSNFEVRDKDLLSGVSVKLTKTPKAAHIFARGASIKAKKGGVALGEDRDTKVQFAYQPPWVTNHSAELSGVIRHVVHYDKMMKTKLDCHVMCILIAAQEALQAATGGIEIPGNPALELDEQVSVLDEGTGTNTRLWIAQRTDTFTSTDGQTNWKTSLSGSWIDTADILLLAVDLVTLLSQQQDADESPVQSASGPGLNLGPARTPIGGGGFTG